MTLVKIQFQDAFYKPSTPLPSPLNLTTLSTFLREFLKEKQVDAEGAQLNLRYRDASGEWHALTDDAQLPDALIDDEKLVVSIDLVATQPVATPTPVETDKPEQTTKVPEVVPACDAQRRLCRKRKARRFGLVILALAVLWFVFFRHCSYRHVQQHRHVPQHQVRVVAWPDGVFSGKELEVFESLASKEANGLSLSQDELNIVRSIQSRAMAARDELRVLRERANACFANADNLAAAAAQLQHDNAHLSQSLANTEHINSVAAQLKRDNVLLTHENVRLAEQNSHLQQQVAALLRRGVVDNSVVQQEQQRDESLSRLFLEVTGKIGAMTKTHIESHLGKSIDDLIDGTAVRKTMIAALQQVNAKLDHLQIKNQPELEQQRAEQQQRVDRQRQQEQHVERLRQLEQQRVQQLQQQRMQQLQQQQRAREQEQAQLDLVRARRAFLMNQAAKQQAGDDDDDDNNSARSMGQFLKNLAKKTKQQMLRGEL